MSSRVPMSMALAASLALSLGLSKEAKANEVAAPATAPENVLNLSAADLEQLNKMGFNPADVEQELAEIEETYGPLHPRDLQRQVSQDIEQTLGSDYLGQDDVHARYMEQLRERYEGHGKDDNRVRLIVAGSDVGNERLRLKGAGLRYELEF